MLNKIIHSLYIKFANSIFEINIWEANIEQFKNCGLHNGYMALKGNQYSAKHTLFWVSVTGKTKPKRNRTKQPETKRTEMKPY